MDVNFPPSRKRSTPKQLVKDAALRLSDEDALFREAVAQGIAAAERGEFVEREEVWANVEEILQS